MQALRNASPFVRVAVALVFGSMSLVHSPLMAFAKSHLYQQKHVVAEHCMHSTNPADDHLHPLPPSSDQPIICNGIGCFSLIFACAGSAPSVQSVLIWTLAPASQSPLRAGVPALLDRPPRLQS
jgi:hypothetical protein